GWSRWREEYDRELQRCRLGGQVPTLEIDPPADEPKPDASTTAAPDPKDIAARVQGGTVKGPGIVPTIVPLFEPGDEAYARWRVTNVRPQKQFGYSLVTATIPLGDVTSAQMRVIAELAQSYA